MTNLTLAPATAKKAAKHGIELAIGEREGVEFMTATLKDGRAFHHYGIEAPAFLTALIAALSFETDGFEGIEPDESILIEQLPTDAADDHGEFVARFLKGGKAINELARDPDLPDLVTTLQSEDDPIEDYVVGIREDIAAEADEDEERSGSVVPDTFKKRYAEAGHPGHCGDWLAVTLNKLVQTMDGKKVITDLDRLEAIANANDVAPDRVDKLGTATNGWQGRYRMTVRNMLAKKVADKGFLFVPEGCGVDKDTEMKAPKEFCERYATKVKAKSAKAAVSKDEGAGKATAKTQAAKAPKAPKPKQSQAEMLAAAKAKAQAKK